jgi:hypothetical protein
MSVLLLGSARSYAGLISLNNSGGNQSTVEASAFDDDFPGNSTSNNVNSLPYTTVAQATDESTISTTTPDLTSSSLSANFSQAFTDDASGGEGHIDIFFTANANATYSISGMATVIGNFDEGEIMASLFDETANTTVYSDDESFFDLGATARPATPVEEDTNTLNLSNASDQTGSMTGSLIAGHTYEFNLSESTDDEFDDPTLTGNGGISFAAVTGPGGGSSTPLPRSAPAALFALMPLAYLYNRRCRSTQSA